MLLVIRYFEIILRSVFELNIPVSLLIIDVSGYICRSIFRYIWGIITFVSVKEGIVVIKKGAVLPNGYVI